MRARAFVPTLALAFGAASCGLLRDYTTYRRLVAHERELALLEIVRYDLGADLDDLVALAREMYGQELDDLFALWLDSRRGSDELHARGREMLERRGRYWREREPAPSAELRAQVDGVLAQAVTGNVLGHRDVRGSSVYGTLLADERPAGSFANFDFMQADLHAARENYGAWQKQGQLALVVEGHFWRAME